MRIDDYTRREFLIRSSFALGGAAAAAQLLSQSAAKPDKRLRGLMVDAARVPEPLAFYRRVIDFCADWGLNALQFRVADDQGCAMRFSSIPDLYFHKHAFALEQLHELAQYARGRGVDLIPELESFGHTGYITRSQAYAHLLDADSQQSSEFTGVIPVEPETLELFRKLYREVAEVFPSMYLHGGCDEVNWGGSAMSRKALREKQRYQIWAEYLNSLHRVAEDLGKQFIVWGDMVVHKEPRILERLNKSIIVMDWNYTETSAAKLGDTRAKIRSAGCRAIGAPALISYRVGPRPGREQLANIDAFGDAYLSGEHVGTDSGCLGVILTNWVPSRYVQNAIWDGLAYAAIAFKEGTGAARSAAFRRFVERHYRTNWNDDWAHVFRVAYENAPQVHERNSSAGEVPLKVPWSSDEELAATIAHKSTGPNPFTDLHTRLVAVEKKVQRNRADFEALLLTAAYLKQVFWREEILAKSPGSKEEATSLIRTISERDRTMAEALAKEWDRGRFADSAAKLNPLFGFEPKDQLLYQFQRAADYSASLEKKPERFYELVTASKRG
jgi:hypothetical protein